MLVAELMTADVVTVDHEAMLDDAVERLVGNGVGSVVVVKSGYPSGIITETDALEAALHAGSPLSAVPVDEVSHSPIVTTSPDATVQRVARQMADEDVKKVPVVDDLDLVGIVTHSDIVWHLSDIEDEATRLDQVRDRWESRRGF